MGILDKVMFWKKKDDFADLGLGVDDFGKDFGGDKDLTGLGGVGTGKVASSTDNLPGFGDREHVFGGGDSPLTASSQAPFTPEVPQQQGFSSRASAPVMSPSQYGPPQYAPPASGSVESSYIISKELEIISSKLDALRVGIDSVSHRLASLERMARGENERNW